MASARSRIESGTVSRTRTPGDLRHDIIQAFEVLDVDSGVNIDAAIEQLFDVEITFGMSAAGDIGVRKLVDQDELRAAGDDRVEVHFLEPLAFVLDAPPGDDFEAVEQRFGLFAAVGLHDADDEIVAVLLSGPGLLQHLIGLADAGCGAHENLQPAEPALLTLAASSRASGDGR